VPKLDFFFCRLRSLKISGPPIRISRFIFQPTENAETVGFDVSNLVSTTSIKRRFHDVGYESEGIFFSIKFNGKLCFEKWVGRL